MSSPHRFPRFRRGAASLHPGQQSCCLGGRLVVRSYKHDLIATAKHLRWRKPRCEAAVNYAEAFPDEISQALIDNDAVDFVALKRMLPRAVEFTQESLICERREFLQVTALMLCIGHDFSRAEKTQQILALAPEVRLLRSFEAERGRSTTWFWLIAPGLKRLRAER